MSFSGEYFTYFMFVRMRVAVLLGPLFTNLIVDFADGYHGRFRACKLQCRSRLAKVM